MGRWSGPVSCKSLAAAAGAPRPAVRGPFLWIGDRKLIVKGVAYGTFAADAAGDCYPARDVVARDFAAMRAASVNTVRTYTAPPSWLLEEARSAGLRLLIGIWWEGRNCTYDEAETWDLASAAVREAIRRCREYPEAVLGYVLGNEIPPLVIRFHGRRVLERFLDRLHRVAKAEDPEGLVTYGNYPTSEFLQLDFLDFDTLNVYLLDPSTLGTYIDRMLVRAGSRPLVLGEVGDDSLRGGEEAQAALLDWTLPLAMDKGLAGVCVFSWTDEWFVAGQEVSDWQFGLVDKQRRPKPALEVVERRFAEQPRARRAIWPRVSVIVCNYNGRATLDETLSSLLALDYPDYEIVYVDDGSTDDSLSIARRYEDRIRIIAQANQGLSAARNAGATAATGEIVAFIDSDAFADADWLRYLVHRLEAGGFAAAGGPNLTPDSDGLTAQLIASCPGNPTVVLKDEVEADHLAGVNIACRRDALIEIGGFDPVHRKAGDDVDFCWRLLDAGKRLAYAPAAVVWHHRRPSVWKYLKQQIGYGEAENQLERKHPERFNANGQIQWSGRVYMEKSRPRFLGPPLVDHGHFGTAPFQALYDRAPSSLRAWPVMIQWYCVWILLFALVPVVKWTLPFAGTMALMSIWTAGVAARGARTQARLGMLPRVQKVFLVAFLHFVHPLTRAWGRVAFRIARRPPPLPSPGVRLPGRLKPKALLREVCHLFRRGKEMRRYSGTLDREARIGAVAAELRRRRIGTNFGQRWDNYDIQATTSPFVGMRLYSASEFYPHGLCWGARPTVSLLTPLLAALVPTVLLVLLGFETGAIAALFSGLVLVGLIVAQRARLRNECWAAIDAAMTESVAEAPGSAASQ